MKTTTNKKGMVVSLANVATIGMILVVAIATMVVGVKVNQQIGDGLAVNATAYSVAQNVSIGGTTMFANIGTNFTVLGTLIGLALVITTLIGGLVLSRNN